MFMVYESCFQEENATMKRLLCCVMLLLALSPAAHGETIDAFGMCFHIDTATIDFDAAQIQITDAQELAQLIEQLPNLTEVRLFDSSLSPEDMLWLFDSYPDVFFGFTITFDIHTIRTDDTAFSTLHHHHFTNTKDSYHTNEQIDQLRMCTRLKALDLGHNKLTDLSFLTGLTDLRVLIISPNYSLEDLSPLANLTKLEYLEVFSTETADVSPLAGLTQLKDLNLACSDRLKDISCLFDALPNLERFWCGRTPIPEEQRQQMEAAHPGCAFNWTTQPTSGGWRTHPRYDVLYTMFRGTEYIPFD